AGGINGYRNVVYFTQWGIYERNYQVADLKKTLGDKVTHVNYAFENISHSTLKCFAGVNKSTATGVDEAGDAWADYGRSYSGDQWDTPMKGNFGELKRLKKDKPNVKVLISLGGWSFSKEFSRAAATDESRKALVSSCIDLFIKGNLPPSQDATGGKGVARGIFDGFDLDWEWPGSDKGNVGNSVDYERDALNLKLLAKEFRSQLDEYSLISGKRYELSAFLPANPAIIRAGQWNDPELFKYIDFGNVQGYDFQGGWDPILAGHQGNLWPDPKDPRPLMESYSADAAVRAYTEAGVPPSQLTLGMALYGRGWKGVASSEPWSTATAPADGVYEAGINDYDLVKKVGKAYFDEKTAASWRYDATNKVWWSMDDEKSIAAKTQYVKDNGLGGSMYWELSGDDPGTLVAASYNAYKAGPTGPVSKPPALTMPPGWTDPDAPADPCQPDAWKSSRPYVTGERAGYNGKVWEAAWWTTATPGSDSSWKEVTKCGAWTPPQPEKPDEPAPPAPDPCDPGDWDATTTYRVGWRARHDGRLWEATLLNTNHEPAADSQFWQEVFGCDPGTYTPPKTDPVDPCVTTPWDPTTAYWTGEVVTHADKTWQAHYYTKGHEPGTDDHWAEFDLDTCNADPDDPDDPDPSDPPTPDPSDPPTPDPSDPATPDPSDPPTPDPSDPATPDPSDPATPGTPDPSDPTTPTTPGTPGTDPSQPGGSGGSGGGNAGSGSGGGIVTVPGPTVTVTARAEAPGAGTASVAGARQPRGVPALAGLAVQQRLVVLTKGHTLRLAAHSYAADGAAGPVKWVSANPKIASVSASGKVKGLRRGTARLVAYGAGHSATVKVRVLAKPSKRAVSHLRVTVPPELAAGQAVSLATRYCPDNATGVKVRYVTSNPAVATVDKAGRLVAVAPGEATITVKAGGQKVARRLQVN
ncbi:MAG: Ig-like domain-containing protein, partial [Bifidobacteriaceae bacterium]|nr:Ig-like domain-containing protein [Bifidobacteriaceae bacterium]